MRERRIEYKCRRCGKVEKTYNVALPAEPEAVITAILYSETTTVFRTQTHACDEGGLGIMDFIGISPKRTI